MLSPTSHAGTMPRRRAASTLPAVLRAGLPLVVIGLGALATLAWCGWLAWAAWRLARWALA